MAHIYSSPLIHIAAPSTTPKLKLNNPNKTNTVLTYLRKSFCTSRPPRLVIRTKAVEPGSGKLQHEQQQHNLQLLLDRIGTPMASLLPKPDVKRVEFPPDFLFGASTSALQIEGPGNEGGRGEGTWDSQIGERKKAADSYHLYKEDVKLLKQMGMNAYRFSIAWPRILPNGTIESGINQEGIDYYNHLIDELIANGITPIVTLLHFDLPQALQDKYKGFLRRDIIKQFTDYADLCFKNFGDRVKIWGTINEPSIFVYLGKQMGIPPELRTSDKAAYTVSHYIILAHSAVVKHYRKNYKKSQGGKVGISLPIQWSMPYSSDPTDVAASEAKLDLQIGWYMNPLVHGDYPEWMKNNVKGLPEFSQEDKELVKGAFDYIGLNYYTSRYIEQSFDYNLFGGVVTITYTSRPYDVDGNKLGNGIPAEGRPDIYNHPDGLRQLILHMKNKYGNPELYITENGVSTKPKVLGSVEDLLNQGKIEEVEAAFYDDKTIDYIDGHLKAVRDARREGGNVKGYVVWSLMDNLEPGKGYDVRFGLNFVDYFDNCKRYPKKSAKWLTRFLQPAENRLSTLEN